MHPILTHVVILLILVIPILSEFSTGQPGHQASAAAWAVGLLFLAGLWVCHAIISSGLAIWRYRARALSSLKVAGLHCISAVIILAVLFLWAVFFG
jgi:hypothetical protein